MKVFIHIDKHYRSYYIFNTPEEQQYAWLGYFRECDDAAYYDGEDLSQISLIEAARNGDWRAARRLGELRCGYEYERYDIDELYCPPEKPEKPK